MTRNTILIPDAVTLSERQEGAIHYLIASFMHGPTEIVQEIAVWHLAAQRWELLADAEGVRNYRLAVDALNGMAGHFEGLCFNCHGLKEVNVTVKNSVTRWRGRKKVKCPVCKAKGVVPKDRQLRLVI